MVLTFVVPVGNYHRDIAERALASVLAQSMECQVVVVYDTECRGAGWARNRGLEQVNTPFVAFLDADDWLEPTFAEETLRHYDGRRYVYTDWITDQVVEAPPNPWSGDGTSHIVTTLLPTAFVKYMGGFDEHLPGGEDTDFYWKLTRNGLCGKRLPEPLFHYGKEGKRAYAFVHSPEYQTTMQGVVARYEGAMMACGDCGDQTDAPNIPTNEQQPGDVLAETLWNGTRPERGRISGRVYRGGWGQHVWMDARDVDAAPQLFARVVEMPGVPTESNFQRFGKVAMRQMTGGLQAPSQPEIIPVQSSQTVNVPVKADVAQVLRLYQNTQQ